MRRRRTLRTIALTAALGLGVWTLAFTFTTASFNDGDILSAEALNSLLNDNFAETKTELERLEDTKLTVSNSGQVSRTISFRANSSSAAVSIKNSGTGHLLQALGGTGFGTAITNNGDILLGPLSAEGAETIRISAEEGTITNNVGSGLPLAFGTVASDGTKLGGTTNWDVEYHGPSQHYRITINGVPYDHNKHTLIATSRSHNAPMITVNAIGHPAVDGTAVVVPHNSTGSRVQAPFHFVIYDIVD